MCRSGVEGPPLQGSPQPRSRDASTQKGPWRSARSCSGGDRVQRQRGRGERPRQLRQRSWPAEEGGGAAGLTRQLRKRAGASEAEACEEDGVVGDGRLGAREGERAREGRGARARRRVE